MSHHIYHTRGIILESQNRGESNRFYKIFTEELGLVWASAQSVREGRSKLRYVLQDNAIIFVDLVRGKEVWRITSASEEQPLNIVGGPEQKKLFIQTCSFLSRLLQGEGREEDLFIDVLGFALFLMKEVVPHTLYKAVETLTTLRALFMLGYIDGLGYESFLVPGEYSVDLINNFNSVQASVTPLISGAVNSSHL